MARNKYTEIAVNRILDTAMKLFMTKGYEHITVQDIINEFGNLSKGAIYHHFKSKEYIMGAVNARMLNDFELLSVSFHGCYEENATKIIFSGYLLALVCIAQSTSFIAMPGSISVSFLSSIEPVHHIS